MRFIWTRAASAFLDSSFVGKWVLELLQGIKDMLVFVHISCIVHVFCLEIIFEPQHREIFNNTRAQHMHVPYSYCVVSFH